MARPRQPIDLLLYKGKKNLTKEEIEERQAQEVKAPSDKVKPPSYLDKDLKKEFRQISNELVQIGIMSNLDVDALARFLIAKKMYLDVTNNLLELDPLDEKYSVLLINQDKLFKQCRQSASDLGLTISSRCKLVIPKTENEKPKTEAEKRFGNIL